MMDKIVPVYVTRSFFMENGQTPNNLDIMNSGWSAFLKPFPLLAILFELKSENEMSTTGFLYLLSW